MNTASRLVSLCIATLCIATLLFIASCTNSTDFSTPRTITTPIANDTTRPPSGGGVSVLRITSFTPTAASTGTVVVIAGNGFSGTVGVSFGGIPASSFTVVSDSLITAIVGANATSGTVAVNTTRGSTSLGGFTFIPSPLQNSGQARIISFTPVMGGAGTTISITGAGFTGATQVQVGGVNVRSFTVVSPTRIDAVLGNGATGSVSVTTPSGVASLAGFTFIPPPTITSYTPISAPSGAVVTINGTNFTGATAVQFGGINVRSFTVISPTQITAIVGTGATGSVSVTTPSGTASLAGFTFVP